MKSMRYIQEPSLLKNKETRSFLYDELENEIGFS
jgi:hypothetical protein